MSKCLRRVLLLATLVSLWVSPAQASIRTSWSVVGFPRVHAGAPLGGLGVPTPAPSRSALGATVTQMTGLAPSAVTTVDACGAVRRGFAHCDAQVMILRAGRGLVRPHVGARRHRQTVRAAGVATPAAAASPAAVASAAPPQAGTPAYLQQAYDTSYLSQTAGAGDTVAIVSAYDDPTAESDLATYRATYGLGACTTPNGCFTKVNQTGATSPLPATNSAWEMETSLDLDAVSALCPRCTIVLIEANTNAWPDLSTGEATAATMGADQISDSWSSSYASPPAGSFTFPGIATVASTGDFGYAGGQDDYPAAFADVTAVGGTKLTPASGGASLRGFAEAGWSVNSYGMSAGSGCDLNLTKPPYQTDFGCTGRSYADVSADADPSTGLVVYDSDKGGWIVAGGTSLSAPLVAAFYAITGVSAPTPQWAYADSSLLNDPASGSNGSCASAIAYICSARTGYDGLTGVGSISGAIADGAPGIGGPSVGTGTANTYAAAVASQTATLSGGVYPNGLDTTYWWEYGTTTTYGLTTSPVDIGTGRVPVAVTSALSNLAPRTVYHYRLVAQNALGTSYGYDYTLTTTIPPPANTSPPSISGMTRQGQTLTALVGAWTPAAPMSYTYQWQRDSGSGFVNITGATSYAYMLGGADLGANLRVIVTAANGSGSSSVTTASVGPVLSGAPVNTSPPTISGTPQRYMPLTLNGGNWSPAANTYAIQWQRDTGGGFVDIPGAVGSSYVPVKVDEGANLRVVLTGRNLYGSSSATSAAVGPVIANAPATSVVPTISGTAKRGYALTVYPNAWSPGDDTFAYQWDRCDTGGANCTAIAGATSQVYTVALADEGTTLVAVVTATNTDGSLARASAPTPTIVAAPPVNLTAPWMTGSARVGATLTTTPGTWTPLDSVVSYQWQRSSASGYQDITGATAATYVPTAADVGETDRVLVTATNPDGSTTVMPAASLIVGHAPVNTVAPASPSGTLMDGAVLTADNGTWDSSLYTGSGPSTVSYGYQWLRCAVGAAFPSGCANVVGNSTYRVATSDIGAEIAVRVTATTAGGSTMVLSALTGVVVPRPITNLALPVISGTPQIPLALSASSGSWSGIYTNLAYAWSRCDATGANCTPVLNGTRYPLGGADRGATVIVTVTATGPGGVSASASSAPMTIVDQPMPHSNVAPSITGVTTRLNALRANPGVWVNSTSFAYQWERCDSSGANCQPITGATGLTYSLVEADVGARLTVQVSASNTSGTVVASASATAAIAANPPVLGTIPVIAGVLREGKWLGYQTINWAKTTGDTTFSVQWKRCLADGTGCQPIPGAIAGIYLLTAADAGSTVMVTVTATNPDASIAANSRPSGVILPLAPTARVLPVVSRDPGNVGDLLTLTPAVWNGTVISAVDQFERCTIVCVPVGNPGDTTYTIDVADVGAVIRAAETGTNAGGTTVAWSSSYVGPVRSAVSGSAVLGGAVAAAALRNASGTALAFASIGSQSFVANAQVLGRGASRSRARIVQVRRARKLTGALRAWACPVSGAAGTRPPACSRAVTFGTGGVRLTVPGTSGRVRLIVVRIRRNH